MRKISFDSFADASDYAKSLARQGCKHSLRADGAVWTVDVVDADNNVLEDGRHAPSNCKKCSELSALLETGKSMVSGLKSENSTLRARNEFLESELDRYKRQLSSFQERIARQDAEIATLENNLARNSKALQGLLSK